MTIEGVGKVCGLERTSSECGENEGDVIQERLGGGRKEHWWWKGKRLEEVK